eukprot:6196788-Pleurochrysis_carterae.AAC.4
MNAFVKRKRVGGGEREEEGGGEGSARVCVKARAHNSETLSCMRPTNVALAHAPVAFEAFSNWRDASRLLLSSSVSGLLCSSNRKARRVLRRVLRGERTNRRVGHGRKSTIGRMSQTLHKLSSIDTHGFDEKSRARALDIGRTDSAMHVCMQV